VVSGGTGGAGPPPDVPLASLVRIGHEVALRARRLGVQTLAVEIAGYRGPVRFTFDQGRVEAVARGWELELSALEEWGTRSPARHVSRIGLRDDGVRQPAPSQRSPDRVVRGRAAIAAVGPAASNPTTRTPSTS
jgi:hypothetical protein